MALELLTRVATKAIGTATDLAGGAASGAWNYLSKNAPQVLNNLLRPNPVVQNINKGVQDQVANTGRLLQETVSKVPLYNPTPLLPNLPKSPNIGDVGNMIKPTIDDLWSATQYTGESWIDALRGIPASIQGKSPQEVYGNMQAPTDAANRGLGLIQDFTYGSPNTLINNNTMSGAEGVARQGYDDAERAIKATKEAIETGAQQPGGLQAGFAKIPNAVDDITGKVTERFFRPKNSRQIDFVADAKGGLTPVKEAGKKKTAELLEQIPANKTVDESLGGLLEAPKTPLSLPQPKGSVTITQLKQLIKNGDNLDGVTFVAKNADEAREALRLGVPNSKIVTGTQKTATNTLFSGEKGISKTLDQAREAVEIQLKNIKNSGAVKKFSNLSNVLEPTRLLKKVLPDDLYAIADDSILAPLNRLRGEAAVLKQTYQKRISALGGDFKIGSKMSELTQKFGEGKISSKALIEELGDDGAKRVMDASQEFRSMYDEILDTVNAKRLEVGLPEIAKRQDYFRHMNEMGKDLGNSLSDLFTGGAGQRSSSIMKRRTGDKTTYDAVGGMLDYLERAGRAGFTDTVVPRIKDLSEALRSRGDIKVAEYLDWYADSILGVRPDLGSVGNFVTNAASKMRGSRVVGNLSSLINQTASIPTGANDAGLVNYLKGVISKDGREAAKKSSYLIDAGYRQPLSFYSGGDKLVRGAGVVLQEADMIGKKSVWQGMYQKAKGLGVPDAIRYADEKTALVMGGRGIGSASKFQDSWYGGLIAPFTNEAQTAANRVIELVGEKKFGTLLGIATTNWMFNQANEKYGTGNRVLVDPVDAIWDSYKQFTGTDEKEKDTVKAAGRLLAESLQFSPVAQSIAVGAYQLAQIFDPENNVLPDSQDIFGSEDPTRMGSMSLYNPLPTGKKITGNPLADAPLEMAAKFLPFGNQAVKSTQSLFSQGQGYIKSRGGNAMFSSPKTTLGNIRAVLFGQYASKDAREYFENDFSRPLYSEEQEQLDTLPKEERAGFIEQAGKEKINKNQVKGYFEDDSWFSKLTGGKKEPTGDAIKSYYFDDKSYTGGTRTEKKDILNKLLEVAEDEKLSPEMKAKVLESAGVSTADFAYYKEASLSQEDRLQAVLGLASKDYETRDELITQLAFGKRTVGGKAMFSTAMFDSLYDRGLIDKQEKQLLSAIKYDPIYNKFYMDRDYKGGSGGGGATASKIKSYINSINSLYKNTFKKASAKVNKMQDIPLPQAPKPNFKKAPKVASSTSTDRWFTPY